MDDLRTGLTRFQISGFIYSCWISYNAYKIHGNVEQYIRNPRHSSTMDIKYQNLPLF